MKRTAPNLELLRMQQDWDERARSNARHYVNTAQNDWTDEDFFASGLRTVENEIRTDMINICQGKDPKQMTVLEIGCGAGRVTRALAEVFGSVYAVDVSAEMVLQAQKALSGVPNVCVRQNNGWDLTVLGDLRVDFAFSTIVFQHVPKKAIIENYVREVHRMLRPRGLFKFQVQGDPTIHRESDDTWIGVPFSEEETVDMALRNGFEPRYRHGASTQYFWLWYFKRSRLRQWAIYSFRRASQYFFMRRETASRSD